MTVHLTSANSGDGTLDGTLISSQNAALPEAMRISFTADGKTWVYDPGMGNTSDSSSGASVFGLPSAEAMTTSDDNAMFDLKQGVDKPVLVHIWLEGTDPVCTDELRSSDYEIRLRFTGTDENGRSFSGQ